MVGLVETGLNSVSGLGLAGHFGQLVLAEPLTLAGSFVRSAYSPSYAADRIPRIPLTLKLRLDRRLA
ncbi:hypothetical protein [Kibdelosporangium persicum]|uniref:hypothetical protein n=1 Tax=Kibdelosporangium persicum TaxID=2698649 RepID=UPI001567A9DB|nr:hypothetical protein [Kibdelosporangium persicum]